MELSGIRNYAYSPVKTASNAEDKKPYGHRQLGIQSFLPVSDKRKLTDIEKLEIENNLNNWLPQLFPGYGTPVPHLLASPSKTGTLTGVTTGGLLGGAAAVIHGLAMHDFTGTTAAIGAAVGGVAALATGILGYFRRNQENSNLIDLMKRLPEGATQRDLMSDPVYQQEQQMARLATGGLGNAALTAGVLGAVLRPRED